jgi:uncharacterized membrane protein
MPFCSQCGNQVGARDVFCAKCGGRQPVPQHTASPELLSAMSPRTAAILCYIPLMGWICAIVVLAAHRFRDDRIVRFHAFQGLYLFVAWLIADQVLGPMFGLIPQMHIGSLLRAVVLGLWIFMLIKASHEEAYSLPVIGELAERSVAER